MIPYIDAGYLMHGVVDLFINPDSGEDLAGDCPFLIKTTIKHKNGGYEYACGIHDKKPDVCRSYLCDELKG